MQGFGALHRIAMQAFVREMSFEEDHLLEELRHVAEAHKLVLKVKEDGIDQFMGVLNAQLIADGLGVEVTKRKMVELDGKTYWVLINTRADEISKRAAELNDFERVLFKNMLSKLAKSKNGDLSFGEIKDIALLSKVTSTKFVKHKLTEFLERMVDRRWLSEGNSEDTFTAGPRTLAELQEELGKLGAKKDKNGSFVIRTKAYRKWAKEVYCEDGNSTESEDERLKDDEGEEGEDEEVNGDAGCAAGADGVEQNTERNTSKKSLTANSMKRKSKSNATTIDGDDDDDDEEEEAFADEDSAIEEPRSPPRRAKRRRNKL